MVVNNKRKDLISLAMLAILLILVNALASLYYAKWDWTEDQRYSMTPSTLNLLDTINQPVFIKVLLEGEFPSGFKRLQIATDELLRDFRSENGLIEVVYEDPLQGSVEEVNQRKKTLTEMNILPVNFQVRNDDEMTQKLIYPYAIISQGQEKQIVNLLEEQIPGQSDDAVINRSINLLEYKFSNALRILWRKVKPLVMVSTGNGEIPVQQLKDFRSRLVSHYRVGLVNLDSIIQLPEEVRLLVIPRPTRAFSEKKKFLIDQYVMRGGRILWFIDALAVDLDSLQGKNQFIPPPIELNLNDDLFFEYGVRINNDLALDAQCSRIPLQTGVAGGRPRFDLFPYYYHPVIQAPENHSITKNLGLLNLTYANTIDTLETKFKVKKTPLLTTSENSMRQLSPMRLNFDIFRYKPDYDRFTKKNLLLGVLLEGRFSSLYENRVTENMLAGLRQLNTPFKKSGLSKMAFIADGDMLASEIDPQGENFAPMGYNRFERVTYDNANFITNIIDYLIEGDAILASRNKELKIRLLDKVRIENEKLFWQFFNLGLPILILITFGILYIFWRHRKYT